VDTDGDGTGDNSDFIKTMSRYQTQNQLMLDIGLAALILFVTSETARRGMKTWKTRYPPPIPLGFEIGSEEE
jgi:uncharacterized SAM-binding protein YcdF (DUF218 family)